MSENFSSCTDNATFHIWRFHSRPYPKYWHEERKEWMYKYRECERCEEIEHVEVLSDINICIKSFDEKHTFVYDIGVHHQYGLVETKTCTACEFNHDQPKERLE